MKKITTEVGDAKPAEAVPIKDEEEEKITPTVTKTVSKNQVSSTLTLVHAHQSLTLNR